MTICIQFSASATYKAHRKAETPSRDRRIDIKLDHACRWGLPILRFIHSVQYFRILTSNNQHTFLDPWNLARMEIDTWDRSSICLLHPHWYIENENHIKQQFFWSIYITYSIKFNDVSCISPLSKFCFVCMFFKC